MNNDMTMTREEMLEDAYANKGNVYATEEMHEEGNCVLYGYNGCLMYGDGEEIVDEEELPEDGWIDFTGYQMEFDDYNPVNGSTYRDGIDILYDENDEY